MKIAVAGVGYVGLSLACLLSKHHDVTAIDIDTIRVESINAGISPIRDELIETYLASRPAALTATTDPQTAYANADIVIIATPTNYDDMTHSFDTTSIESVLDLVAALNPDSLVVIKSTIPVGYTEQIAKQYPQLRVLFSPEFLREGHALGDNLHPSRIVVGTPDPARKEDAGLFAQLLAEGSKDDDTPVLVTGATEAEAIKLFANTYLAHLVLQRAGYICGEQGARHQADTRGRVPRPPHWQPLQQPVFWLWRLLPAKRLQAAFGKLRRYPARPHARHRRLECHAQGLHSRAHLGQKAKDGRCLPPCHEGRVGQFPPKLDCRYH